MCLSGSDLSTRVGSNQRLLNGMSCVSDKYRALRSEGKDWLNNALSLSCIPPHMTYGPEDMVIGGISILDKF